MPDNLRRQNSVNKVYFVHKIEQFTTLHRAYMACYRYILIHWNVSKMTHHKADTYEGKDGFLLNFSQVSLYTADNYKADIL